MIRNPRQLSVKFYLGEGKMKDEKFWAIKGIFGFYTGWWLTRKEAIKSHTELLGKSWDYCRKKGDKAVKIIISELNTRQTIDIDEGKLRKIFIEFFCAVTQTDDLDEEWFTRKWGDYINELINQYLTEGEL